MKYGLEAARQVWARNVRPLLPRQVLVVAAALCRALHWDIRLLHWLFPSSPAEGFNTETPATPPAIYLSLRRVASEGLGGDYYEFGLYRGYTFWFAQQAADSLALRDMHFFGFDSFEGLPEPTGIDASSHEFRKGDYACSHTAVVAALGKFGFDWSRAHLIEGFYSVALKPSLVGHLSMGPVAMALIDCDLYESTVPVLRFLAPLLQPGTILLFDDWNCFGASEEHGQRRAFREFLASFPEWRAEPHLRFGWHGEGFVLRRSRGA